MALKKKIKIQDSYLKKNKVPIIHYNAMPKEWRLWDELGVGKESLPPLRLCNLEAIKTLSPFLLMHSLQRSSCPEFVSNSSAYAENQSQTKFKVILSKFCSRWQMVANEWWRPSPHLTDRWKDSWLGKDHLLTPAQLGPPTVCSNMRFTLIDSPS